MADAPVKRRFRQISSLQSIQFLHTTQIYSHKGLNRERKIFRHLDWSPLLLDWSPSFFLPSPSAYHGTVIVCIVSEHYLPFLDNWLFSVARHGHRDKVLIITEDYGALLRVNERWSGHAVIIPPVLHLQSAHKFGSQDDGGLRVCQISQETV